MKFDKFRRYLIFLLPLIFVFFSNVLETSISLIFALFIFFINKDKDRTDDSLEDKEEETELIKREEEFELEEKDQEFLSFLPSFHENKKEPISVKLLTMLFLPLETREIINTIINEFSKEFNFSKGHIYIFDLEKDEISFSKNLLGHYEKKPSLPHVLDDMNQKGFVDKIEIISQDEKNYIYIPLFLSTVKTGFLFMESDSMIKIDRNIQIARNISSLALFSAILKKQWKNLSMDSINLKIIKSLFVKKSVQLIHELTNSDFTVFTNYNNKIYEINSKENISINTGELDVIMDDIFKKDGRFLHDKEILVSDENMSIREFEFSSYLISFFKNRSGIDGYFSIFKEKNEYNYHDIFVFRLLNDLLIKSLGEIDSIKINWKNIADGNLISDITELFNDYILNPEISVTINEMLSKLNKHIGGEMVSLICTGNNSAVFSSTGEKTGEMIQELVETKNLEMWLNNQNKTQSLRELEYLNDEINLFLMKLGFVKPENLEIMIVPIIQKKEYSSFLIIISRRILPELAIEDKEIKSIEKIIISFISAIATSFKDKNEKEILKKEIEKMERLAAIGKVAAGVAHEIRNPLGGIELYVSSLKADMKDEKSIKWLNSINSAVKKLNRIVGDLLLFAREDKIETRDVHLLPVINEVIELQKGEIDNKKIELTLNNEIIDPLIKADPVWFSQILTNLLKNSIESIDENGKILISIIKSSDSILKIKIEDNGPGIEEESVKKIFDPFFTTKKTGTGLGLSISLKLIEKMGGTISYFRSSMNGAGFEISISSIDQVI